MSKKIVVITGSPRKKGNSFAMTEAFIKAAQVKGYSVTRFDAAFKHVSGCHACETCYKTGKACSFDDDFNELAPSILEADAIVFTMPVYWYSIPAQIKCVIDKMYSLCVGKRRCRQRMRADRLLRRRGYVRIGRSSYSLRTNGGVAQMEVGRRSSYPRSIEYRGHR